MRLVAFFILFLAPFFSAFAIKGYPYPIKVMQPDGSSVTIMIKGDEYFNYRTTIDGSIIAQKSDGFYYYADYNSGKLRISDNRVSGGTSTKSTSVRARGVPVDVSERIREQARRENRVALPRDNTIPIKALVIPVQFSDVTFKTPNPKQHFDEMINLPGYSSYGATGSVADYFKANYKDKYNMEFVVTDVVTLPKTIDYYGGNDELTGRDIRPRELIIDACKLADPFVNFAEYDNNHDGKVDYIFVYYAGYSEAEGGAQNSIWPHSWNVDSYSVSLDGVRLDSYSCAAELYGVSGETPAGIGTFCHEFSHMLGLVDLYDVDYDQNGLSAGLWGTLDLMDFGCFNNNGRTPPYLSAINREILGIANIESFTQDEVHTLTPINHESRVYKVPTSIPNEYFLFEVRSQKEWDLYIGGGGMLVYHIDKSEFPAGAVRASVRWKNNIVNTFSKHQCADLVEAYHLSTSIPHIFFPGTKVVTEFSTQTNPPFIDWSGKGTGFKITNIVRQGDNVSFNVSEDKNERVAKILSHSITVLQTEASLSWESDINVNTKWGFRWGLKSDNPKDYNQVLILRQKYQLEALIPNTDYTCQVFSLGEMINGDTLQVNFRTIGLSSPYPYIYGLKSEYFVGDIIELKLFNLNEEAKLIEWVVDNKNITGGKVALTTPGKTEIKCLITYTNDKSVEVINKKISVKSK